MSAEREQLVLNVGCGPPPGQLPPHFAHWRQVRVDLDPAMQPDVIASLTDLSPIPAACADALWAAHCVEHLYAHEVPRALAEFRRVLRPEGFACIIVPDLQSVAQHVAADRMHETLYQSAAGPITPHDVFFGHGAAIAAGQSAMAHRCGFTPGMLQQYFREQAFAEVLLQRRVGHFELVALARMSAARDAGERAALMASLGI